MVASVTASNIRAQLLPVMAQAREGRAEDPLKINVSTVVEHDGRVLMIREGRGRKRGLWNLPGGKAQRGEALVKTAVRETREETGYLTKPVGLLSLYIDQRSRGGRGDRGLGLRLHLCAQLVSGEIAIDGEEVLDVRWFELEHLGRLSDKKLWNPHLIRQSMMELARWTGHPLRVLREVNALLVA